MNKERLKLWIDTLRSDKFTQGIGALKRNIITRHCCLGVLCEIYKDKTDKGQWEYLEVGGGRFRFVLDEEKSYTTLPPSIRDWLGISTIEESRLISMNDTGTTFKGIADYLEKKYLQNES